MWFYFDQLLCMFVDEDSNVTSGTQSAIIHVYATSSTLVTPFIVPPVLLVKMRENT